jgi:hypothetical protein
MATGSLERYQAALMTVFSDVRLDAPARMRALSERKAFAEYAEYLGSCERPLVSQCAATVQLFIRPKRRRRREAAEP